MVKDKLYTVDEALAVIPLSKSGMYAAIKKGNIETVKIGKRKFIPGWFLSQLINIPPSA